MPIPPLPTPLCCYSLSHPLLFPLFSRRDFVPSCLKDSSEVIPNVPEKGSFALFFQFLLDKCKMFFYGADRGLRVLAEQRQPTNRPNTRGDISSYPQHVESFETYYFLGEMRTLKATAQLRFQALHPECPPDSPHYKSKFESFYTKIKRWARKENWEEWVARKELEERHKRESEMREKIGSINRTLRGYQGLIRQAIIAASDKVKNTLALRQATQEGDEAKIARLSTMPHMEIRSFKELKDMIELDIYVTKLLEQQPALAFEEGSRLSEDKAERVDQIMEALRKQALDTGSEEE